VIGRMRCFAVAGFALMTLPVAAAEDTRQGVKMPPEARAEMRAEMLDFQTALHGIIVALGEGKLLEAADIAEKQIGLSAMGRHRNAPATARPGVYMSSEMHGIARGMHGAASEFAKAARSGDLGKALTALPAVTGACVACHRSYRTE
jgi:hypothetical protein